MMKPEEMVDVLMKMDPESLRLVFALAGRTFGAKAETLYDQNPEENGDLAQPYADIADMFNEAAGVFDATDTPVEEPVTDEQQQPVTVTAAVSKARVEGETAAPLKNHWGKY